MTPRASAVALRRELLGAPAVTPNGVDGVLSALPSGVNLRPPDEVSARPELRPVSTGRGDDLEVGHFWLLTLSVAACGYRRFGDVEARRDVRGRIGRHRPSVVDSASSRLLLTANWRLRRVPGPPPFLCSERYVPRSTERLTKPSEHRQVSVKPKRAPGSARGLLAAGRYRPAMSQITPTMMRYAATM
jgi:hypothetical protein